MPCIKQRRKGIILFCLILINPTAGSSKKSYPTPLSPISSKMQNNDIRKMNETMDMEQDDGAINEKKRLYNQNSGHTIQRVDTNESLNKQDPIGNSHFVPSSMLSHQLHALVGLDRYPNYLSRWSSTSSLHDITKLEKSFEDVLEKIRHQKQSIQEKKQMLHQFMEDICIHEEEEEELEEEYKDSFQSLMKAPTTWEEIQNFILDPRASKAIFQSKWFTSSKSQRKNGNPKLTPPTVEQVLNGEIDIHLDAMHLENWLDQEMFDVYSFPLLSKQVNMSINVTINVMINVCF